MTAGVPGYETELGEYKNSEQEFASANAVSFMDLNGDAWPDLLVTNKTWTSTDVAMWYLNLGDDAEGNWLGFDSITYDMPDSLQRIADLPMGVAASDMDNDGDLDIVVTDFLDPVVLRNDGLLGGLPQFKRQDCCKAGYTWGVVLEDFDRNGYLDMHISTNGNLTDNYYTGPVEPGVGNSASVLGLGQRRQSRGTMVADYDRDGWPDLFVVNLAGTSALYRNQYALKVNPSERRFLAIRLHGDPSLAGPYKSTRDALGARVFVTAATNGATPVTMRRDLQSGGSNATSSGDMWLRFGVGVASTADVTIQWPSGRMTTLNGVAVDQYLTVTETE